MFATVQNTLYFIINIIGYETLFRPENLVTIHF